MQKSLPRPSKRLPGALKRNIGTPSSVAGSKCSRPGANWALGCRDGNGKTVPETAEGTGVACEGSTVVGRADRGSSETVTLALGLGAGLDGAGLRRLYAS